MTTTMIKRGETKQTRHRRRKEFTKKELVGLRVAGRILRDMREMSPHPTLRSWIQFLQKPIGGDRMNLSDIQRYETAGYFDPKAQNYKQINPMYIFRVAQYLPYNPSFLIAVTGGYWESLDVEPLGGLVMKKRKKLGRSYLKNAQNFGLTARELDDAEQGLTTATWGVNTVSHNTEKLAQWLGITPEGVLHASIVQLADTVQTDLPDQEERVCKSLEDQFRDALLEGGFNLGSKSGLQGLIDKLDFDKNDPDDKVKIDLFVRVFEGEDVSDGADLDDLIWAVYCLTGKRPPKDGNRSGR